MLCSCFLSSHCFFLSFLLLSRALKRTASKRCVLLTLRRERVFLNSYETQKEIGKESSTKAKKKKKVKNSFFFFFLLFGFFSHFALNDNHQVAFFFCLFFFSYIVGVDQHIFLFFFFFKAKPVPGGQGKQSEVMELLLSELFFFFACVRLSCSLLCVLAYIAEPALCSSSSAFFFF